MIRLAGFFLLCSLCIGCACGVRNSTGGDSGPHTAATELSSLGGWLLWVGGIGLALGMVGRFAIASPAFAFLRATPIGGIIGFLAEACAVALACGIAFMYLADNFWLLIAAGVATGLAWAFRYRARIRRWLRLGSHTLPKINTEGVNHGR